MSDDSGKAKTVGLQGTQSPNQYAQAQPYKTFVGLSQDPGSSTSERFIPADAVLALNQGIAPTWTSVHTFSDDANFYANVKLSPGENQPVATLNVDGSSLKYTVSPSGTHEFYVGEGLVGQIDDPSNPSGDNSLVSKSYVDQGGGPQPGTPKKPAVSIGDAVSDGSASTYMRSDVVLALDEGIAPQWSSAHTFLGDVRFAPPGNPDDPNATLNLDGDSLRYTVTQKGGAHEFSAGQTQLQLRDISGITPDDIPDNALVGWGTIKQYANGHNGAGQLQMMVSYGAQPVDHDDVPDLSPANSVTIYGTPELQYIVLVDESATLLDAEDTHQGYYHFKMGPEGVKRLSIQMPLSAGKYGTSIRCALYDVPSAYENPDILAVLKALLPVENSANFYPPISADINFELIRTYSYTRGVPADTTTPAQICVIVEDNPNVDTLSMHIDGDAVFQDGTQQQEASITKPGGGKYGWVLVNVYSGSSGVSKITISAPASSNLPDTVVAYPSFLSPPSGTQSG